MKRTLHIILLSLLVIACTSTAEARGRRDGNANRQQQREQLAQRQANYIADQLNLDDQTTRLFVDTYCQYQREIWKLGSPSQRRKNMTDTEAQKALDQRLERNQKILELRKKYQKKYSKFLTPQQILQVYDLEDQLMQQMRHRRRSRR